MKDSSTTKKNALPEKLLAYSAAAGAVMAIGGSAANAQVVYTDINPDTTLMSPGVGTPDSLVLDLNNDGTDDLFINHKWDERYPQNQYVAAYPLNNGEIAGENKHYACGTWAAYYDVGVKFEPGDTIDENRFFLTGPNASVTLAWNSYGSCLSGPFDEAKNKFLGVRFHLGDTNSMHYGWVRLEVADSNHSVTVKDYAYEQTANKMIYAGDKGSTSVRDALISNDNLRIFSIPNHVVINFVGDFKADAEIINTLGQRVKHVQVNQGRTEIPVNRSGIYFIRLSVDGAMITRKVFVE